MLHVQLIMNTIKKISLRALRTALDSNSGIVLLEALPIRYFDQGHLPGALQIPNDETLGPIARELIPDKATSIIVYCASATCENSKEAAEWLAKLGYTDVSVFEGGKAEWTGAGLAMEISGKGAK